MPDSPSTTPSRRDALKAAVMLGTTAGLATSALGDSTPTPAQTEGPFYPDLDNDLTFVSSRKRRAKGNHIYIHGVVRDIRGQPISNALVDIWQTDHQGIYDHAGDPNRKNKDENFQSYGRFVTGVDGSYCFKSIKPRHYGSERFRRTPHIHYKVARRGYHELTTQLYFEDEPEMNANDGLFNQLSKEDQKQLTIAFSAIEKAEKPVREMLEKAFGEKAWPEGIRVGRLNLVMRSV